MSLPVDFRYIREWLDPATTNKLFDSLLEEIDWREQDIILFGRRVAQPRLMSWCADPGVRYAYSGLKLAPAPWHPDVDTIRQSLEAEAGQAFNSCLLNQYRNGRDSMGWHSDNEPELGPEPVVASVSLGAERRFLMRPVEGGSSIGLDLAHGSLLIMGGRSQADWRHSVPKTKRQVGPRINLTFRTIVE